MDYEGNMQWTYLCNPYHLSKRLVCLKPYCVNFVNKSSNGHKFVIAWDCNYSFDLLLGLYMFAKYSFCMALWSVTVSTACGDLPQHQSRGLIQVSYTRILVKLPWIALTHLETCANKQISSYLGLLLTTTTTIWILIAPFVNYVYAASFLLH